MIVHITCIASDPAISMKAAESISKYLGDMTMRAPYRISPKYSVYSKEGLTPIDRGESIRLSRVRLSANIPPSETDFMRDFELNIDLPGSCSLEFKVV